MLEFRQITEASTVTEHAKNLCDHVSNRHRGGFELYNALIVHRTPAETLSRSAFRPIGEFSASLRLSTSVMAVIYQ